MANSTNYVFLPVDNRVKVVLYSLVGVFGLYAVAANGLILYFKRKQTLQRKGSFKKAFDRFMVTSVFIQSLAASDLLCAVVSLPLAISTNFVHIIDSDFICKAVRFCNIFFPVVTICNLFVIGVERYLAVFHPFQVPSLRQVKGLVVASWVMSVLFTIIPSLTYRLVRRDFDEGFTFLCAQDKTVPIYRIMFLGFTVIIYVIPAMTLIVTSTRILLYMKKRRRTLPSQRSRFTYWRYYGTFTFVALIFTFVIPYFLFVLFSGLNIMLKLQLTLTSEYVLRRVSAVLAYSNSAISPTVLLYNMQDLRRMLRNGLKRCFSCNVCVKRSSSRISPRNFVDPCFLDFSISANSRTAPPFILSGAMDTMFAEVHQTSKL